MQSMKLNISLKIAHGNMQLSVMTCYSGVV